MPEQSFRTALTAQRNRGSPPAVVHDATMVRMWRWFFVAAVVASGVVTADEEEECENHEVFRVAFGSSM